VISGTPTAAGTSAVTVTLQDSAGTQVSKALSIAVAAPGLVINTASLTAGTEGTAYSLTLSGSGGTPAYSWSATGLPAGLACSAAGVISGTPASSGSFTVVVKLSDSAGASVTKSLSLSLTALPENETSYPYPSGTLIRTMVLIDDPDHNPQDSFTIAPGLYGFHFYPTADGGSADPDISNYKVYRVTAASTCLGRSTTIYDDGIGTIYTWHIYINGTIVASSNSWVSNRACRISIYKIKD
jgi:hypothetical protein